MRIPKVIHDQAGRPTEQTDFDYDDIERKIFGADPKSELSQFSQEDIDGAVAVLRVLLQWIWQDGMKNADGLKIRAIICCWIFLHELRPLSLTELARGFNLEKQSLGRWFDVFKRKFPAIKTCHMRHD